MEMKFLTTISNRTKKSKIINTYIRLEQGVDKIKNDIQKIRLRWFGHVMRMGEERISKKMLRTKLEGKLSRGRPRTTGYTKLK